MKEGTTMGLWKKLGEKVDDLGRCPKCQHAEYKAGCDCTDDRCVCNPKVKG